VIGHIGWYIPTYLMQKYLSSRPGGLKGRRVSSRAESAPQGMSKCDPSTCRRTRS
jgi:hypothetical protein